MADNHKLVRSKSIAWRVVGDETVLVPVAGKQDDLDYMYVLNDTATLIWSLMDGQHTERQIVDEIVLRFEIDEGAAREDLAALLAQLAKIEAVAEA
jgi:hypothetical protein